MNNMLNIIDFGDKHVRNYKYSRLNGKGCKKHCPCEWCRNNRLYKSKHQVPVKDVDYYMYNFKY
jgi:hypothetical protein